MATLDLVSAGETNWATQQNANLTALNTELIATTAKANAAQVAADLDDDTAALAADPESALRTELNAAIGASFGAIFPEQFGAVGDGVTDDTDAIRDAFDAAAALTPKATVWFSSKTYLVSAPIDMQGASARGSDRFISTILADETVGANSTAPWSNGAYSNDQAILYALNESDWSVKNLGIDGGWVFASCVSAVGGHGIEFIENYARNSGKCALQFLGARHPGDLPVSHSTMRGNLVSDSIWGLVMDGTVLDSSLIGNISERAVQRHISIDPGEAGNQDGSGLNRGLVVSGNVMDDIRTAPVGKYLSGVVADGALATIPNFGCLTFGSITGNTVHNWGDGLPAYYLRNFRGAVTGNYAHNDGAEPRGGTFMHLSSCQGSIVTGNVGTRFTTGVSIDASTNVTVQGNRFVDTTTKYATTTLGAGTVLGPDASDSTAPGQQFDNSRDRDTGWRDVSSVYAGTSFEATGTTPRLLIRRIGDRVLARFRGRPAAGIAGDARTSAKTVLTGIPANFAPIVAAEGGIIIGAAKIDAGGGAIQAAFAIAQSSGTSVVINGVSGNWATTDDVQFSAEWTTAGAWPNTYPGSAI